MNKKVNKLLSLILAILLIASTMQNTQVAYAVDSDSDDAVVTQDKDISSDKDNEDATQEKESTSKEEELPEVSARDSLKLDTATAEEAYLCFVDEETPFTVTKPAELQYDGVLQYRIGGSSVTPWQDWGSPGEEITLNVNLTYAGTYQFYIRGLNNTYVNSTGNGITMSSDNPAIKCIGNFESLLNYETTSATYWNHPPIATAAFKRLFYNNTCITDVLAPLTPKTLTEQCYYEMFAHCTNLQHTVGMRTTSDATISKQSCAYMYYGCTNLKYTDDSGFFPASDDTPLAEECFAYMLAECRSLDFKRDNKWEEYDYEFDYSCAELSYRYLAKGCFSHTFLNCTATRVAPRLDHPYGNTLAENCFESMFEGTTSMKYPMMRLPMAEVPAGAYKNMFKGSGIVTVPKIGATNIGEGAMTSMFESCERLHIYDEPTLNSYGSYSTPWTLNATAADDTYQNIFSSNTDCPVPVELNKTYYRMGHPLTVETRDDEIVYNEGVMGHDACVTDVNPQSSVKIRYSRDNDGTYELDELPELIEEGTGVGVVTIYFIVTGMEGFEPYRGELHVTIKPAEIMAFPRIVSPTIPPYIGDMPSTPYTGDPVISKVVVERPESGAVVKYGYAPGSYPYDNAPEISNSGTHTIYYKVTAPNYEDLVGSYSFKITPIPIQFEVENYSGEFDDNYHSGKVNVTFPENEYEYFIQYKTNEWQSYYDYSQPPTFADRGTHTVYFQIKGSGPNASNYRTVTGSYTVEISRATSMEIEAEDQTFGYDGKMKYGSINLIRPAYGTIEYSDDNESWTNRVGFSTLGPHQLFYKVTDPGDNYETQYGSIVVNIIELETMDYTVEDFKMTRDGSKFAGGGITVNNPPTYTIRYSKDNGRTWYDNPEDLNLTGPGTYTLTYEISAPGYHTVTGTYTVSILYEMECMVESLDFVYDGKWHDPAVTWSPYKPSGAKVVYSEDGENYNLDRVSVCLPTGEVKTYYYKATANSYYDYYGTFTVNIEKREMVYSAEDKVYYIGAPDQYAGVNVTEPKYSETRVEYSMNNGETYSYDRPTFTEEGVYTILYKITPYTSGYRAVSGSYTVTAIKGKEMTVKADDIYIEYDGGAHQIPAIEVTDPTEGETVKYYPEGSSWTEELPIFTEIGPHVVRYKVTAEGYIPKEGSFTVWLVYFFEYEAVDCNAVFDEQPHSGEVNVTKPNDNTPVIKYSTDDITYSTEKPTFVNVTTEPQKVYFTIEKENYKSVEGTFNVNVRKADINVTTEEIIYDDADHDVVLTATSAVTNEVITDATFVYKSSLEGEYTSTIPKVKEAGEHIIYYKASAGDNYNEKEGQITVVVTDLPNIEVEINDEDVTFPYDGKPHSATVTVIRPEGIAVQYSRDGVIFTDTPPEYIEVGEYTVHYKAQAEGYSELLSSYKLTITKAPVDSWDVEATDVTFKLEDGTFDPEEENNITVNTPSEGYSDPVFSLTDGDFENVFVAPTEEGEYTVYFKITHPSYEDYVGSYLLTLTDREMIGAVPIYLLFNENTGEHLLTASKGEYDKLQPIGWTGEGIGFYGYKKPIEGGDKIYRIFNPNVEGGDHHYTKSLGEARKRVAEGWQWDFGGNAVFYALGDIQVNKLFYRPTGRHHYTRKQGEVNKLVQGGWENEGIAWYGAKEDDMAVILKE